jgi:hypothetical protein
MKKPATSESIAGWKVAGGGHEENERNEANCGDYENGYM